jgi:hypothetical protein
MNKSEEVGDGDCYQTDGISVISHKFNILKLLALVLSVPKHMDFFIISFFHGRRRRPFFSPPC